MFRIICDVFEVQNYDHFDSTTGTTKVFEVAVQKCKVPQDICSLHCEIKTGMKWNAYYILLVLVECISLVEIRVSLALSPLQWHPVRIQFDDVAQAYPETLWRRLTSSVPRREFAIQNVSLTFDSSGINMLLGSSSAGKSTILRLIRGTESPVSGDISIAAEGSTTSVLFPSTEITSYLDSRPSYAINDSVQGVWKRCLSSQLDEELLVDMSSILEVPLAATMDSLSQSQVYLCRLGEACLQSITATAQRDSAESEETCNYIAPILLIDEWLDTEASAVVQNVQKGLQALVDRGAVVICITHRPQLFQKSPGMRQITLSQGRMVSVTTIDQESSTIPPS